MAHENTVSVEYHREMVERAYRGGWIDGFWTNDGSGTAPDGWMDKDWDNSDAKAALPEQGDEDHGKGND